MMMMMMMNASIHNFRANYLVFTSITPSQLCEPIIITPAPDWPFQKIVTDLFLVVYLVYAHRLTGWLILYHLKTMSCQHSKWISICQKLFHTYDTPEELSSDGDPPFSSKLFLQFLKTRFVKHRQFSVAYLQSNGRWELTEKTAKRIINGNSGLLGSFDNDKLGPFCNTAALPSKALVYHRHNCSTTDFKILFLYNLSSTNHTLNG